MVKRNPKQIEAFQDPSRFKFILAGRRAGKTYLIIEDIIKTLHEMPNKSELLVCGPSNIQIKELVWNPIEDRLREQGWKFQAKISAQQFVLSRGRKIYILGAEKISRVRGHKFFKAYVDEVAFFTKDLNDVWRAIRPTLTDHGGGAIVSTTPNGKGTQAYDFYMAAVQHDSWRYFHWMTLENPYIDPDEVEAAKRELDERSFRQEYQASWESFEGLAYYNFDETTHIKKQPDVDVEKPVHICMDFNVNPTTLLLSQYDKDMLRYKKEYSFKHSSTEATVEAFCEDFKDKAKRLDIRVRGDATGKARSASTGRSDYFYVEEQLKEYGFQYEKEVPRSNPPIIDRVKVVNGWLKPFRGPHRIEIDPACKNLIRDLGSQECNGRIPSDANNLGHKADALGYDCYWEYKKTKRPRQATIIL